MTQQHRHSLLDTDRPHTRVSDDGPGASRTVAIGRHPKPFTFSEAESDGFAANPAKVPGKMAFVRAIIFAGGVASFLAGQGSHLCDLRPNEDEYLMDLAIALTINGLVWGLIVA